MNANSRKKICPACKGVGAWGATHLDPSEVCEVCNGAGRVSKRTALRYNKHSMDYRLSRMHNAPRPVITDVDNIPF